MDAFQVMHMSRSFQGLCVLGFEGFRVGTQPGQMTADGAVHSLSHVIAFVDAATAASVVPFTLVHRDGAQSCLMRWLLLQREHIVERPLVHCDTPSHGSDTAS